MTADQAMNLLVTVTLIEMMAAIGLGVSIANLLGVAKDWRLLARAAAANYVCVPLAAAGLLHLFHAQPMVKAGFLILAVCPGAPYRAASYGRRQRERARLGGVDGRPGRNVRRRRAAPLKPPAPADLG